MSPKLHFVKRAGDRNTPLCGSKTGDPQFSDMPTCLRCKSTLERQRREKFMRGFDVAAREPFATVSGPRINPRNRHNHAHVQPSNLHVIDDSDNDTVSVSRRARVLNSKPSPFLNDSRPLATRRQQIEAVSRRLSLPPARKHVTTASE